MKKLIILTFLVTLVAISFNSSAKVSNKDIVGDWNYEAPTAPYGFEKGIMAFSENEGALTGVLKLNDGSKIQLQNVKLENDLLTFSLYVEGGYVTVRSKIEDDTLTGSVDTPDGEMKVTAKKAAKE